jgi:hypothetical protein
VGLLLSLISPSSSEAAKPALQQNNSEDGDYCTDSESSADIKHCEDSEYCTDSESSADIKHCEDGDYCKDNFTNALFPDFDDISPGKVKISSPCHWSPQVILIPNHRVITATTGSRHRFVVFQLRTEFADGMVFSTWHRYSAIRKVLLPLIPRTSRLHQLFPPRQPLNRSAKKLGHARKFHLQFFLQKLLHRLFFFDEVLSGNFEQKQLMRAKQAVFRSFVRGEGAEGLETCTGTSTLRNSHKESIIRESLSVVRAPSAGVSSSAHPLSLSFQPFLSLIGVDRAPFMAPLTPFVTSAATASQLGTDDALSPGCQQHHQRARRGSEVSPTHECSKTITTNFFNTNCCEEPKRERPPTPHKCKNPVDSALVEKDDNGTPRYRARTLFKPIQALLQPSSGVT